MPTRQKGIFFLAVISITFLSLQVLADSPDMEWVYIDDPGVPGHEGFNGYMSKYEATNAQYAEYLNSAMDDGEITIYDNVVYASDDSSHSEPYFDTYSASSSSLYTSVICECVSRYD